MKHSSVILFVVLALTSCAAPSPSPTLAPQPAAAETPLPTATVLPTPTPLGGGGQIAFISKEQIRIYQLATGKTSLATGADTVSLSLDGKKLVFSSSRCPARAPGQHVIWCRREIYSANADGSNVAQLTYNKIDDSAPAWSPDGRKIVWTTWNPFLIHVMNADGSAQKRLPVNRGWQFYPAWSPDGNEIVFSAGSPGKYEIYITGADGSWWKRLTKINAVSLYPAWSPDGARIAFSVESTKTDPKTHIPGVGKSDIFVMNADGTNPTNLTNGKYNISQRSAWSPDESMLAFVCDGALCMMNSTGTGIVEINGTDGIDAAGGISWSLP